MGLKKVRITLQHIDNIYKEKVAVDYANGNWRNPGIAVKVKGNGDCVITKVV